MSDPCDFLTPTAPAASNPDLRRRLLDNTSVVLRRRRRLRRAYWAAAFAACYAAGTLTTHWLRPAAPLLAERRPEPAGPEQPADAGRPPERPSPGRPDLESDRVRLLVKAADHALADKADPLAALYGYTKALDEGGDAALAISTDDSFLMMAIKDARKKERVHAKILD
jgi:hypothetical protein